MIWDHSTTFNRFALLNDSHHYQQKWERYIYIYMLTLSKCYFLRENCVFWFWQLCYSHNNLCPCWKDLLCRTQMLWIESIELSSYPKSLIWLMKRWQEMTQYYWMQTTEGNYHSVRKGSKARKGRGECLTFIIDTSASHLHCELGKTNVYSI